VCNGGRTWSWRLRSGLVWKREKKEIRVRVLVVKERKSDEVACFDW